MMNQLIAMNAEITMSSREIAELIGKKHNHVMRDIRSMLSNMYMPDSAHDSSYVDVQGREMPSKDLPRDLAIMLLGRYGRFDLLKQMMDGAPLSEIIHHVRRREYDFGEVVANMFSGYEVIPQFQVLDGKYRIDWYIPELKLAIEYDEDHHAYSTEDDRARQSEIELVLGCRFARYSD